jgi:hypothetical protein
MTFADKSREESSKWSVDHRIERLGGGFVPRLGDSVMCWLALCGLANLAVGFASFLRSDIHWLGELDATPIHTAGRIVEYFAISAAGFAYMLWRSHWQCRAAAIWKAAAFLCVAFILVLIHPFLWVAVMAPVAFVYTLVWASRERGA